MNFLDSYLTYSASNEAPTIYHKWAALSALSHLAGPRISTYMGGHLYFYPNMYINLVGRPGIMKSTAMKQAQELIENFKEISIAPASISKEAMTQKMASKESKRYFKENDKQVEYSQLSIFANEFVSLLNASGNPNGMIEFLTDIWDRPGRIYDESFKNSGSNVIKRPYITTLCCLTPKTLEGLVNNKVITGGMSRRTLNITAERNNDPVPFIYPSQEQVKSWEWCIQHARNVLDVCGPFSWTEDARELYINWYVPFKRNIENESSEVLQAFYMSKAEYVIKISMLLAIASPSLKLEHTYSTFSQALSLVTEIERGACALFEHGGRNELVTISDNLVRFVKARGKASHQDIKLFTWKELKMGDQKELQSMLEYLLLSGKLKIVREPGPPISEHYIAP